MNLTPEDTTSNEETLSSITEKTTEELCKALKIDCWEEDNRNNQRFTKEAQDIFNDLIDTIDAHLTN